MWRRMIERRFSLSTSPQTPITRRISRSSTIGASSVTVVITNWRISLAARAWEMSAARAGGSVAAR